MGLLMVMESHWLGFSESRRGSAAAARVAQNLGFSRVDQDEDLMRQIRLYVARLRLRFAAWLSAKAANMIARENAKGPFHPSGII
jgi:hypothetical protein